MAEQKCPMCGKLNPPELDVCQYCEARLKPLVIDQPEDSQSSQSQQSSEMFSKEDNTPDWLRSLRDRQVGVEPEPGESGLPSWSVYEEGERLGSSSQDDEVAPDWLDSLRGPSDSEEEIFLDTGQEVLENDEGDEEDDDWMPSELEAGEEDTVPDWLTGLRVDPENPDLTAESLQGEEGGSPDWLERIRSHRQAEEPAENLEPEQQKDLPDWLRTDDLSTAGTTADWPSSIRDRDDEPSPDWLPAQPSAESNNEPESDDTFPDWLQNGEEQASPADEFPDWLETGDLHPDEQGTESEQPDWQAGTAQTTESATDEGLAWLDGEGEASPVDNIPDWFHSSVETSQSHEEIPERPSGPSQASEGESTEGLPEWLQRTADEESEEPQDAAPPWLADSETDAGPAEELPDWLPPEEMKPASLDEIPDWVSEISDEEDPLETDLPDRSAEDLPDWLADLDQKVEADEAEALATADESGLAAGPVEQIHDWLAGVEPGMVGETGESQGELIDSELASLDSLSDDEDYEQEVPDWLADVTVNQEVSDLQGEKSTRQQNADLAPAELPSWLEAMRPVEAEAAPENQDDRDRQIVNVGPLAGLRGVLPAEPEISKVQKPPAYSVKLHVSDMQQERASMLEELVHAEGVSRPIPKRPLVSSQNLLRIIFAFVLFLAILWPLVTEGQVAAIPVFTPETGAANQLIGQINSQDPVLVAVDYQPGLSGEMDAVASALFDHLMLRGAYLTLVSTTASGPIQAEHVVTLTNQQYGHSYLGAGEYTNLGYIPGGPTGLISFASNPQAMMTYALDDGRRAWENSPLQSVQNLTDFALVTVITENPETARAWIEQVQPVLAGTPMIMAISAQAEPMVRPYYEAFPKQVQGMVIGLTGSIAYESLMGHQGLSHGYWNSFGIGLLVAIALIFIGGVFNMIPILSKGGRENLTGREGSR